MSSNGFKSMHRTIYRFGSIARGHYGFLALRANGQVRGYEHPNEAGHNLSETTLRFLTADGTPTSELTYFSDANVFLSPDCKGLYLLPTLTLKPALAAGATRPVIVNSIPKSGTYLLDLVLQKLGLVSLRLHLSSGLYDDNRQISGREIHIAPHTRRFVTPANLVAEIMQPGEYAIGHIENADCLARIEEAGAIVINCVRDLRNVLASLYKFKLSVVAPLSSAERQWREAPEKFRFLQFLIWFQREDIKLILDMARLLAARPVLRFEDLIAGRGTEVAARTLASIAPDFADRFAGALLDSVGQDTATLSTRPADFRELWSDAVQTHFEKSGLAAANAALGYT